jgi:site-specific recombinase XerD
MATPKLPELPAFSHHESRDSDSPIVQSYANGNRALAAGYRDYVVCRGFSPQTVRTYCDTIDRFVEALGSASALESDRPAIRKFLSSLLGRGASANTVRKHTCALRSFFKFLQMTRLTRHDPTLMLSQRKLPRKIPRVLTITEIARLIAAAKTPVEAAVAEFLYATGVRVSELIAVRLENIDFAQDPCIAHVKKGKGGKDRTVLFGPPAHAAVKKMIDWRPPQKGFLFEARSHEGTVHAQSGAWYGTFYDQAIQRTIRIGAVSDIPSRDQARQVFDAILAVTPGYRPKPPRPYTDRAIRLMIARMGVRASIGKVYPHSLRRAFSCHMLEDGADLRVIQELLGHARVTTTALYTSLSAMNLKEIHKRCHPKGGDDEQK